MNRRLFGKVSVGALGAVPAAAGGQPGPGGEGRDLLRLGDGFRDPVRIRSVEALRVGQEHYVRVRSAGGAEGLAAGSRLPELLSLLGRVVAPFFVGKDARELEALVDDVYLHDSNYKFAGMPFWNAVAHVELATLDMLGKMARRPVGALLGEVRRAEIPVYISRFSRDTGPEQEVDAAARALQNTGAGAVKLKVGLRMRNSEAQSRRDRRMVELARRRLGDGVALYLDANGSYTPAEAVGFGRFLAGHGVGFLEEPCPWEEYEQTREVADALELAVAGGEQDSSVPRFRWLIRNRALDLLQPDIYYNGGLIRALRVARLAAAADIPVTPHSPKAGPAAAPMLHFASVVPNTGPHQEYLESADVRRGVVQVPTAPGLGFEVDPGRLRKAELLRW